MLTNIIVVLPKFSFHILRGATQPKHSKWSMEKDKFMRCGGHVPSGPRGMSVLQSHMMTSTDLFLILGQF